VDLVSEDLLADETHVTRGCTNSWVNAFKRISSKDPL
jgi:hypothetical protein